MRIGSQQHPVTIQRRVQVGKTSIGEPNFVWKDWRTDVWCEVLARRGKEQFDPQTKQRFNEEVYHFRTRYEEVIGIDATMQVLHEGGTYEIRNCLPDMQKRSDIIIECRLLSGSLETTPLTLAIADEILPGYVGDTYESFTAAASGGTAPYTISAGASLPPGLSISSVGLVSGTPTAAGTYVVTISVTDASGDVETLPEFTIEVF